MSKLKALEMKQEPEKGTEEYKVEQILDMLWSFLEREDYQRMDALRKKAEMFEAIRVELAFPDLNAPEELLSFLYKVLQVKKGITPQTFDFDIEK
ncbi:MAG: hypothetical protein DRR08_13945 [Candidatus Parabeggiatoa sp. nov. 2]|nr:MAG: hypothetical protein B6247_08950 [Beggiatoa sp. 4572_84]RKZ59440.1 MAG: hypothetical protein DRR08_13945 [Gammaproteobacteria bacterium]